MSQITKHVRRGEVRGRRHIVRLFSPLKTSSLPKLNHRRRLLPFLLSFVHALHVLDCIHLELLLLGTSLHLIKEKCYWTAGSGRCNISSHPVALTLLGRRGRGQGWQSLNCVWPLPRKSLVLLLWVVLRRRCRERKRLFLTLLPLVYQSHGLG